MPKIFIKDKLAQRIVSQIEEIINQDINFMNDNAIIIASTNKKRVGDFHEGAKIVIDTGKTYNIKNDGKYLGAKKGINIPIFFKNEIVGVLGITGDIKEVTKYGRIVKQMTEILILEQYSHDIMRVEQKKSELIIQEVLFNSDKYEINGPNTFLGVNFTDQFRGIVLNIDLKGNSEYLFYIEKFIVQIFKIKNNSIFTLFKDDKIFIITSIVHKNTVNYKLKLLVSNIKKKIKLPINIGVGKISSSIKDLNLSLIQAKKVVLLQKKDSSSSIFYDDLDLGIILTSIEPSVKDYFVYKILGNIPSQEIDKYNTILSVYEKHNKSITKGAEELFIHKNTFQYQLNKITDYTGYDPKTLEDFVILKLAFSLA